jgi:hypothetical protein
MSRLHLIDRPEAPEAMPSEAVPLTRPIKLVDSVPIRDRLLWDLNDITALTGLSRRFLERQLATGAMVACDTRVGRRCFWKPDRIIGWLDSLSDQNGGRP